jgi:hypothetical protein
LVAITVREDGAGSAAVISDGTLIANCRYACNLARSSMPIFLGACPGGCAPPDGDFVILVGTLVSSVRASVLTAAVSQ